ncbi:hypothetical protein AK830_g9633 [Neonectria ditissima]|uniref:FAD linked oxidase N-terminal domain-containing protein n=1 Tax=Neonectria ditissima TaxID=78410 RepID=A0A0P7B8S4_9HYPO|nr:hypothetical protein AK830_g9633 [Neonectria ditissima]
MHWFKTEVLAAVAVSAVTSSCASLPVPRDALQGTCPGSISDLTKLVKKLSNATKIYFPGSDEFTTATTRWSVLDAPKVNFVVVPGTENDVVETVKYANEQALPFLAFNTAHGAITTLGKMDHGVEIYMDQLSSVKLAEDGQTVTIGGGTKSKLVTDTLWAAGKQTGKASIPKNTELNYTDLQQ